MILQPTFREHKSKTHHCLFNVFEKEGPSTLAILITEDPTALQYWSELQSPHPHHPPPIHMHEANGSKKKEGSKEQWKREAKKRTLTAIEHEEEERKKQGAVEKRGYEKDTDSD